MSYLLEAFQRRHNQLPADAESVWYPLKSTQTKFIEESTFLLNLCTTPWIWGVATPPLESRRRCQKLQETRVYICCKKVATRSSLPKHSNIPWVVSGMLSVSGPPEDDPDNLQRDTRRTTAIQKRLHASMGESDKYGHHVDSWKFRDAVKTTYNDGSSRTRVHLHPSTGKDLTTSHWFATTLSTPRRVQTMESCPWNSGAIVIVFVNDLVEYATLGKSSTVARVANEPQLGKSQLCQTRGQDSRNSRYWVRNLFQGFCGAWQGSKQQPDQIICDLRFGLACRKQSKTKKSKNALSRRQKLDNARKLTRIFFIDPEDEESEEPLKTKQERNSKLLWNRLCPARRRQESVWGATGNCAHESTRTRLESTLPRNHEDHTAEREFNSLTHCNVVHKFVPVLPAMKILDAKAAVNKEWEKLEKIPAWQMNKVKSKKDVLLGAQEAKKKAHFAALMDICHFKNFQIKNKSTKNTKDESCSEETVEDDSDAHAVFSLANDSAKAMDVIARLPGCAGQAADAVSAHTQVKMEDAPRLLKISKSECAQKMWIRLPRPKWPKS